MSFSNRELTPQSGFAKNGLAAQISGNGNSAILEWVKGCVAWVVHPMFTKWRILLE
jgi:hypothetical protein